jgi:IS605 OrfB family transposase
MIRRTVLNINSANKGKLKILNELISEMTIVINKYIEELWKTQDFSSKFVSFKVDTWLSARMQQALGKQSLEIVKSQRKRKKKTKPIFSGKSFNLDSRFVDFQYDNNSFDIWIRLSSLGNGLQLRLPAKKHKHFNKYKEWNQNKSIRLLSRPNGYFIEVFFEKESQSVNTGNTIGIDIGYKSLAVTSKGVELDDGLEQIYEKISRKQQGSKTFKRSLIERNNLINQSLNKLDLNGIREIVCENLKNIKKGTRGKIHKSFNNKLQRWSYSKVLSKLSYMTEEAGILLTRVDPRFTSQKCSKCGVICKSNRKGKTYKCACGNLIDADINAAINISHMGVYSPHTLCGNIC